MSEVFDDASTTIFKVEFFAYVGNEKTNSTSAVGSYFLFIALAMLHHVI